MSRSPPLRSDGSTSTPHPALEVAVVRTGLRPDLEPLGLASEAPVSQRDCRVGRHDRQVEPSVSRVVVRARHLLEVYPRGAVRPPPPTGRSRSPPTSRS